MGTTSIISNLNFSISETTLWVVWILGMFAFIFSSFIYAYHWRNYGTDERFMKHVQTIYIIIGILLLAMSALLINLR